MSRLKGGDWEPAAEILSPRFFAGEGSRDAISVSLFQRRTFQDLAFKDREDNASQLNRLGVAYFLIVYFQFQPPYIGFAFFFRSPKLNRLAESASSWNSEKRRRTVVSVFHLSAQVFLTALAGTFYVQYIYFIDPATAFSFNISVEAALVSIVGGIGTLWGPVIGTVLLEATSALLQSWLGSSLGGIQLTVYSLILIAVILWRPTGLLGVFTEAYGRIVTARI